jgi:hypothetical protein
VPDGIHQAVGVWAGNITWYLLTICHPLSIPIGVPNGGFNGRCFVLVSYVLVFICMLAFCAKSSRV